MRNPAPPLLIQTQAYRRCLSIFLVVAVPHREASWHQTGYILPTSSWENGCCQWIKRQPWTYHFPTLRLIMALPRNQRQMSLEEVQPSNPDRDAELGLFDRIIQDFEPSQATENVFKPVTLIRLMKEELSDKEVLSTSSSHWLKTIQMVPHSTKSPPSCAFQIAWTASLRGPPRTKVSLMKA